MKTYKIKLRKTITIVTIGLLSICSISCSGRSIRQPQTDSTQVDTTHNDNSKHTNVIVATTKDKEDDFYMSLLLYISLGLNVLVICILTKQHLRQNRHSRRIEKNRNDIRTELKKNTQMQNPGSRMQQGSSLSTHDVDRLISQYLSDSRNLVPILDSMKKLHNLDKQRNEESQYQTAQCQNTNSNSTILYAGAAEDATREFYSVIDHIDPEKTIFELHITNNSAEYKVTQSAFNMILREPAYLEVACEVYKKGSSKLINVENGIAVKQNNGKWLITKKAKVTIE